MYRGNSFERLGSSIKPRARCSLSDRQWGGSVVEWAQRLQRLNVVSKGTKEFDEKCFHRLHDPALGAALGPDLLALAIADFAV